MTYPVPPSNPAGNINIADSVNFTQEMKVNADGSLNTSCTPAIVQKTNNVSTGSVATLAKAFAANNTAGNSIIVACGVGNGTAPTVADSAGNTYTQAVIEPLSTTFEVAIFYAVNIVAGANIVTVTNAGTTASMGMEIYEVSGLLAQVIGQPEQSSIGTATGTTASTSAIASSSPNALAFLSVGVGTTAEAVTAVTGTSWAVDASLNTVTPAGLFSFASLSQFVAGCAPIIPQATIAASKPWVAAAAIFKPITIGVQGTVTIGGYNYTHMTTATTTQIKTGSGILHSIVVNKPIAGILEFDDALSNTAPVIGIMTIGTVTNMAPFTVVYDVAFATGLSITTGQATDLTIVWK
jgi:hypothetical protein